MKQGGRERRQRADNNDQMEVLQLLLLCSQMPNSPPIFLLYPRLPLTHSNAQAWPNNESSFSTKFIYFHNKLMHTWSSPLDGLQSTLICRLHALLVSVTNSSIKQCHIICMTSYAWQHISNTADYVILVAMGLTHTHPKLAWHASMYVHESTHLTSAMPSLQSLILHTVKMYKPLSSS